MARDADALTCPYCGEPLETFVDGEPGEAQEYIEDCAVCCRPVRFRVTYQFDADDYRIEVARDS